MAKNHVTKLQHCDHPHKKVKHDVKVYPVNISMLRQCLFCFWSLKDEHLISLNEENTCK